MEVAVLGSEKTSRQTAAASPKAGYHVRNVCALLHEATKGLYTYYGVSLSYTHVVSQLVECLHVLLSAFAHGDVFDDEALVAPRGHGFDVKLFIFGGYV